MLCYKQTIDAPMSGPKDINFMILNDVIDRYGLPWRDTFEKVVAVSRHMYAKWRKDAELASKDK